MLSAPNYTYFSQLHQILFLRTIKKKKKKNVSKLIRMAKFIVECIKRTENLQFEKEKQILTK